jgi:very-short-patch-repair endonuclease
MLTMTPEQYRAHQERVKGACTVTFAENQKEKPGRKRPEAKAPRVRQQWSYEERLAEKLHAAGLTGFYVDSEYLPERQLRADILFPEQKLVVEIQGASHRIRDKWARDIEKAQATILAGFTLLPIATSQVRDGTAVDVVKRVLGRCS